MAAVMRVRRSTNVAGSGGTKTRSLKLHKMKSHEVKSGERGGQRHQFLIPAAARSTASSSVDGRPVVFRLQMQPVS
jgi:hypothetical protein